MRHLSKFLFLLVISSQSCKEAVSLNVNCRFDGSMSLIYESSKNIKTCRASLLTVEERNLVVNTINNLNPQKFIEDQNTTNLNGLRVEDQKLFYVPKGFEKFFPHLNYLTISYCKLREISSNDLKLFEDLIQIDLSNNDLVFLEGDLFTHNSKLRYATFNGNYNLNYIDEIILDTPSLFGIRFFFCGCLDVIVLEKKLLVEKDLVYLRKQIQQNCPKFDFKKKNEELEDQVHALQKEVKKLSRCEENLNTALKNSFMTSKKIDSCAYFTEFPEPVEEKIFLYCRKISEFSCKVYDDFKITTQNYVIRGSSVSMEFSFSLDIKTLIFDDVQVSYLPKGISMYFGDISELIVTNTILFEINAEVFGGFRHLEILNLTNNKIFKIPDKTFSELWMMKSIDLSFNMLEHLGNEAFHNLSNLQSLNLTNNQLSSINSDVFQPLSSLKELLLGNNKLKFINPFFHSKMTQLKTLDLNGNTCIDISSSKTIQEIDEAVLENCINSITFSCGFSIDSRYPGSDSNCIARDLKIELPRTKIAKVFYDSDSKVNYPIKTLSINGESIAYLPYQLHRFFSLHKLIVENSNLQFLCKIDFKGFNELKTIQIRSNDLKFIENESFDEVKQIEFLDLSYNNIKTLPSGIFRNLANLKTLNLRNNNIEKFTADLLPHENVIEDLRLDNNELTVIDAKIIESSKLFSILDLTRNVCIDVLFDAAEFKEEIEKSQALKKLNENIQTNCHGVE